MKLCKSILLVSIIPFSLTSTAFCSSSSKTTSISPLTIAGVGFTALAPYLGWQAWQSSKNIEKAKEYDEQVFKPIETAINNKQAIKPAQNHPTVKPLYKAKEAILFAGASQEDADEFYKSIHNYNENIGSERILYLSASKVDHKGNIISLIDKYLGSTKGIKPAFYQVNTCERKLKEYVTVVRSLYGLSALASGIAGVTCLLYGRKK